MANCDVWGTYEWVRVFDSHKSVRNSSTGKFEDRYIPVVDVYDYSTSSRLVSSEEPWVPPHIWGIPPYTGKEKIKYMEDINIQRGVHPKDYFFSSQLAQIHGKTISSSSRLVNAGPYRGGVKITGQENYIHYSVPTATKLEATHDWGITVYLYRVPEHIRRALYNSSTIADMWYRHPGYYIAKTKTELNFDEPVPLAKQTDKVVVLGKKTIRKDDINDVERYGTLYIYNIPIKSKIWRDNPVRYVRISNEDNNPKPEWDNWSITECYKKMVEYQHSLLVKSLGRMKPHPVYRYNFDEWDKSVSKENDYIERHTDKYLEQSASVNAGFNSFDRKEKFRKMDFAEILGATSVGAHNQGAHGYMPFYIVFSISTKDPNDESSTEDMAGQKKWCYMVEEDVDKDLCHIYTDFTVPKYWFTEKPVY